MHIHQNDEHFIILEGAAGVACGERTWDATAGTAFTVGRGVRHAWCNLSESPLRMLVTFSPGRIEGLFRAVAKGGNIDLAVLSEKFGVRIVGPTLVQSLYSFGSPPFLRDAAKAKSAQGPWFSPKAPRAREAFFPPQFKEE